MDISNLISWIVRGFRRVEKNELDQEAYDNALRAKLQEFGYDRFDNQMHKLIEDIKPQIKAAESDIWMQVLKPMFQTRLYDIVRDIIVNNPEAKVYISMISNMEGILEDKENIKLAKKEILRIVDKLTLKNQNVEV